MPRQTASYLSSSSKSEKNDRANPARRRMSLPSNDNSPPNKVKYSRTRRQGSISNNQDASVSVISTDESKMSQVNTSKKIRSKSKMRWSTQEDATILNKVKEYGCTPKSWKFIASFLPGRTTKQISERWHNVLNPKLSTEAWTAEEDQIVLNAYQKYGSSWTKIASLLNGRSSNAIKNRWNQKLKRYYEQNKCQADAKENTNPNPNANPNPNPNPSISNETLPTSAQPQQQSLPLLAPSMSQPVPRTQVSSTESNQISHSSDESQPQQKKQRIENDNIPQHGTTKATLEKLLSNKERDFVNVSRIRIPSENSKMLTKSIDNLRDEKNKQIENNGKNMNIQTTNEIENRSECCQFSEEFTPSQMKTEVIAMGSTSLCKNMSSDIPTNQISYRTPRIQTVKASLRQPSRARKRITFDGVTDIGNVFIVGMRS
jgi:hypothetical protein